MLNLETIETATQFASEAEKSDYIRSYIFQLYIELEYRLSELDKRIRKLEGEEE